VSSLVSWRLGLVCMQDLSCPDRGGYHPDAGAHVCKETRSYVLVNEPPGVRGKGA
jgi:hypothetical protein